MQDIERRIQLIRAGNKLPAFHFSQSRPMALGSRRAGSSLMQCTAWKLGKWRSQPASQLCVFREERSSGREEGGPSV